MTGKDVWKWIVGVLDDSTILNIYRSKGLVCKGFRTNTLQDVKTYRKPINTNFFLNKVNYEKLLSWSTETTLNSSNEFQVANKETNELIDLAREHGLIIVFMKMFTENLEEEATKLFSLLKDKNSELLHITNQSVINNKTPSQKEHDSIGSNKHDQKIKRLEEDVRKLNEQLKRRKESYKERVNEMNDNHQATLKKLNNKNQMYADLLREKNDLSKKYEVQEKEWDTERELLIKEKEVLYTQINQLSKKHEDEKEKWNKEKEDYEEFIKLLETEHEQLNKKHENKIAEDASKEIKNELTQVKSLEVMVIGKPASIQPFKNDVVQFTFLEGKDVHDYEFSLENEAYWILSYELSQKEQFLLKNNEFYSRLDEEKIIICKDFNEVKIQLKKYSKKEVEAI
ncbi:hypothetical protein AS52_02209 [Priestia megaterium Q3]|uniref:Uncharacterized protein n=1 Tax=Priestia megaterium Q3 TaxID=1452722 RepID=A0A806TGE4_PRIMG|nr:hypothetical protein [Priestia megaterium]AKP77174.1 hypothetical protein AS52_02209 [Priestia megaterium Q3]